MQIPHQLMLLIHCATVPGTDLNSFFIFRDGRSQSVPWSVLGGAGSRAPSERPRPQRPVCHESEVAPDHLPAQPCFPRATSAAQPRGEDPRASRREGPRAHEWPAHGQSDGAPGQPAGPGRGHQPQRAGGSAAVPQRSEPGHHVPDERHRGRRPQKPEVPVPTVRQALPLQQHPLSAHAHSHRREALQVPVLRPPGGAEREPQDPPADPQAGQSWEGARAGARGKPPAARAGGEGHLAGQADEEQSASAPSRPEAPGAHPAGPAGRLQPGPAHQPQRARRGQHSALAQAGQRAGGCGGPRRWLPLHLLQGQVQEAGGARPPHPHLAQALQVHAV